MKKFISIIGLVVMMMLQGIAFADIWVEPNELTRLKYVWRVEIINISINAMVCQIGPETIVEFEPFTSGVYLGHMLDPKSDGLYAFCLLWPAWLTKDNLLWISVWNEWQGGVMFDLPVKTFSFGGGQ
jgi:hypothetical protein